jgi:hypothetical protein
MLRTLTTEPPPDTYGSGIDLFGSEAGYRPGQNTYRMDGIPVSQSQFMQVINSGQIGGGFGVLFAMARMSARQFAGYSLRFRNGNETFEGFNYNHAVSRMEGGETLVRNWFVNDSWSIIGLLATQTQRQTSPTETNPRDNLIFKETKTKAVLNRQKLKKCLYDLFGVNPNFRSNVVDDELAEDESGIFLQPDRFGRNFGDFSGTFSASGRNIVVNIDGAYNIAGLTAFGGVDPKKSKSITNGLTPAVYEGTVYVAGDIKNFNFLLAVAIHEIGNAL